MNKAREIFRRHPWLRVVAWGGFLINGYWIFKSGTSLHFNSPSFKSVAIHSPIKKVEYYYQGAPRVTLRDGRSIWLAVPGSGKEYVQVNDSIVKKANSEITTVYRRYPMYTEARVYGYGENHGAEDLDFPYSALLKRYRIPNPPQP